MLTLIPGPASAPTGLSVVWDPPSAVVSFQSPVYGGECVNYYVVTAVSEEELRNVSCDATSCGSEQNCSISFDGSANINDYNFTIYGVIRVNSSFIYNGDSITDCCEVLADNSVLVKSEPFYSRSICSRKIMATERSCGRKHVVSISWKVYSLCYRVQCFVINFSRVEK